MMCGMLVHSALRGGVSRIGSAIIVLLASLSIAMGSPAQTGQSAAAPSGKTVPANAAGPAGYRIGAGDVLEVNVWKEPEASVQAVVVRPDGKVSLPLVKELDVLGLTPMEMEKILTTKLESAIHGPDVTVVVKEIHSRKIYVVGAVRREGPIPLLEDVTVLQAIGEAGGLNDFAKRNKIYVMRTENGKPTKLFFHYDAVIRGEHTEENIQLLPNDTLVVPH